MLEGVAKLKVDPGAAAVVVVVPKPPNVPEKQDKSWEMRKKEWHNKKRDHQIYDYLTYCIAEENILK